MAKPMNSYIITPHFHKALFNYESWWDRVAWYNIIAADAPVAKLSKAAAVNVGNANPNNGNIFIPPNIFNT